MEVPKSDPSILIEKLASTGAFNSAESSVVIERAVCEINENIEELYWDTGFWRSNKGKIGEDMSSENHLLLLNRISDAYKKKYKIESNQSRFRLVKLEGIYYRVKDYDLVFKAMTTRKGEYLCIGGYGPNTGLTGIPDPLTEGQKEICRKYNVEMI